MYPIVGYGLTSLSKLEAGAQSAGGWAHSAADTALGPLVTLTKLQRHHWRSSYKQIYIIWVKFFQNLPKCKLVVALAIRSCFFKQHTIICLMQILQTTNNLPKDTGRKSVPMQCWDAAMRPAPGHVILLTIIIGPWTEQHQSVTSDHSSATIQPPSRICLHKENM